MTIPFLNPDWVEDFSGTSSKYRQDISDTVFSLVNVPVGDSVQIFGLQKEYEKSI